MHKLVFFTLISASCFSQPLSWQSAVQETEKNNSELQSMIHKLNSADATVNSQYSNFLPTLTGTLGYTYGSSTTNQGSTTAFDSGSDATSRYTAQLTATENLFSGFQDAAKISQQKSIRQGIAATLTASKAKISYDLKSAFASAFYAQQSVSLSQSVSERRHQNLRLVELRYSSGRENKGSVLLSKAYYEQAKLDVMISTNSTGTSKLALAKVLGRDTWDNLEIEGKPPLNAKPKENLPLRKIIETSPAYLQAVADEEASESAIVVARSGFFPSLNLSASTTNSATTFFPSNNRWSIGASLSFPFFSGGRDYFATRSAIESSKAAQLTRANILRDGISKLGKSYTDLEEAIQKLEVDKAFEAAAQIRAKIAREKYNNGLMTFEDWDIIETDLINRQKSLLQSERDSTIAEANWEQIQGKGVFQ